jgi:hypothetical protein
VAVERLSATAYWSIPPSPSYARKQSKKGISLLFLTGWNRRTGCRWQGRRLNL